MIQCAHMIEKTPQNSQLRKIVSNPISKIARMVIRVPGLDANHVTVVGTGIVLASAALDISNEAKQSPSGLRKGLAAFGFILGSSLDMLDGAVAREQKRRGDKRNPSIGAIVDATADRVQETGLAAVRMIEAAQRKSTIGLWAATLAGVSNLIPSLVRAIAESQGKIVPESGKGAIGILGTRAGRVATAAVATFFPETQVALDAVSSAANIVTTTQRARIVLDPSVSRSLSGEKSAEARKRLTALGIFAAVAIPSLVLIHQGLSSHSGKK